MNYELIALILLFPVSAILGCISAKLMNKSRASHFPSISPTPKNNNQQHMKLKLKLTLNQESKIVSKSLQQAYDRNHAIEGINEHDVRELQKALRVVFHYYTGKTLK